MKYMTILFLVISIHFSYSYTEEKKTWAILITGWSSWSYYAMEATIYKTYQVLRNGGIPSENIIIFSPDEIAYHFNNPYPGTVFYAEEEINHLSENVYDNISVDYAGRNNTVANFLAVLTGNATAINSGSGRVLNADPDDIVLISYVGMGSRSAIYFNYVRETLYADKLIPLIEYLQSDKKFGKMLLTIDAYNSGSMFDDYLAPNKHILAITSAGRSGGLWACKYNQQFNTPMATMFNYAWIKYVQMIQSGKIDQSMNTIFDLYDYIKSSEAPAYQYNLYGHLEIGNDKIASYYGESHKKKSAIFNSATNGVEFAGVLQPKLHHRSKAMTVMNNDEIDLYKKRKINRIINDVCETSIKGTTFTVDQVLTKDFTLPLWKFSCYRNLISVFNAHCSIKNNEYIIQTQLYKFARLCSLGVSEENVADAIKTKFRNIQKFSMENF